MTRIVVTAQVEDGARWEKGFRTRGKLLKSTTSTSSHYAITDDNHVAVYADVEDKVKFLEVLESEATAEARAHDGLKRDTVKVFVLDKEFKY